MTFTLGYVDASRHAHDYVRTALDIHIMIKHKMEIKNKTKNTQRQFCVDENSQQNKCRGEHPEIVNKIAFLS